MQKKVTMEQIAKIAGVTRATVDKVLHERPGVSSEVRVKIKEIASELGYRPNFVAKALASQKRIVIGVINGPAENPFYFDIKKGIEKAIEDYKDYGVTIRYREMGKICTKEQIRLIEGLDIEELSALVLVPVDDKKVQDLLNKIADNDVGIITLSSDVPNVKKLCSIGQRGHNAGRIAGDLMAKLLGNNGKVGIIAGLSFMQGQRKRIAGFKEVIEERSPDIEIVDTVECFEDDTVAYNHTVEFINTYSDLKGIYIVAGGIGGVGKAILEAGKEGRIKVVCFDDFEKTAKLINRGVIDFTITQAPVWQGYTAIKVVFDVIFKKDKIESEFIEAQSNIKTRENIKQYS